MKPTTLVKSLSKHTHSSVRNNFPSGFSVTGQVVGVTPGCLFLAHLPCLSASPAVPSPVSYGVGDHHAWVRLHSQHEHPHVTPVTHWSTPPQTARRAWGCTWTREGLLEGTMPLEDPS